MGVIEMCGVSVSSPNGAHRKRILHDISCTFEPGSVTLVIGRTGSGKSTLLHTLAGLLPLEAGSIRFGGGELKPSPKERRREPSVQYTAEMAFQHPERQLFADSIAKEFAYSLRPLRLPKEEARKRAIRALEQLGLSAALLEESPFSLSDGNKRKVAIATVLAMQSEWLLLDEPTAGIDPAGIQPLVAMIGECKRSGTGLIIASHDLDTFLPFADQVLVLNQGSIEGHVTPQALCADTSFLLRAGIGLPANMQISGAMRVAGLPLDDTPLTADAMADAIAAALKRRERIRMERTEMRESEGKPTEPMDASGLTVKECLLHNDAQAPGMADETVGFSGMNNAISEVKASFAQRLHPFSKWLLYLLVSTGILLQDHWRGVLVSAFIVVGLAALARVSAATLVPLAKPFLLFIAFSALLSGVQPEFAPASFRLTGIGFSLAASLRTIRPLAALLLLLLLGLAFVRVTNQRLLLRALEQAFSFLSRIRVPVSAISFSASMILRFLPMLFQEMERLSFIVRARGKANVGRGKIRLRDVPVFFVPFILNMMKNAEDLALTLEARGFRLHHGRPSRAAALELARRDWLTIAVGIALLLLLVAVDAVL